jgi:hypothetical protein
VVLYVGDWGLVGNERNWNLENFIHGLE